MPLQNRVTPYGEIVSDPSRGLMMGNRGCLHGQGRTLGVTRWRSKLWICCLLEFKGVQRDPMPPGRWTALFFLDEVTALAAGHRPCGYCRRRDYLAFAEAWRAARRLSRRPRAAEMDAALHLERTDRTRRKITYRAPVAGLPDGVMVRLTKPSGALTDDPGPIAASPGLVTGRPGLLMGGQMRPWSFAGYGPPVPAGPAGTVEVLTPPSIVAAIAAGYQPVVHPTALADPSAPRARSQVRAPERG